MTDEQLSELSEQIREQTNKNLEMLGQYLHEVLDNPAKLDEIPNGSTIVFLPEDDPVLAQRNFAMATKTAQEGKDVWLYRMGTPRTDVPAWMENEQRAILLKALNPQWPANLDQLVPQVHYFRDRDLLYIEMLADALRSLPVPRGDNHFLLVDRETQVVRGYLIPAFTESVVPEVPQMARWLRIATPHASTPPDVLSLLGIPPQPAPVASLTELRREMGDDEPARGVG